MSTEAPKQVTAKAAAEMLMSALGMQPSMGAIVYGGDRWVVLTFGNWNHARIEQWMGRPVEWVEAGPFTMSLGATMP